MADDRCRGRRGRPGSPTHTDCHLGSRRGDGRAPETASGRDSHSPGLAARLGAGDLPSTTALDPSSRTEHELGQGSEERSQKGVSPSGAGQSSQLRETSLEPMKGQVPRRGKGLVAAECRDDRRVENGGQPACLREAREQQGGPQVSSAGRQAGRSAAHMGHR